MSAARSMSEGGRHRRAECTRNVYRAGSLIAAAAAQRNDAGAGDATAPASTDGYADGRRIGSGRAGRPTGGTVAAMPIPRRYTTDAIVLSRFDLGEADRVLTLITPGDGKLKAIAKGVRRPTSPARWQPRAVRRAAPSRWPAAGPSTSSPRSSVGHAWLNLRDSLESAATAWYLAELADRSLEERHAAEPLYTLLRRAYELLDAGMAPGPRRALVRDAPARRARPAARGRPLRRMRPGPRGRRARSAGCRRSAASCASAARGRRTIGPAHASRRSSCSRPTSASTSRRSPRSASRRDVEREVEAALRDFVRDRARARRPLAGLPRRGPDGAASTAAAP